VKSVAQSAFKRRALEVSAAAGLVFVASFLPWGVVEFSKLPTPASGELGDAFHQMLAKLGAIPVTAWNGYASIAGLKVPNLLVLLAAVTPALAIWLKAASNWKLGAAFLAVCAGYGLAHASLVFVTLHMSEEGSPRIGVVLTALAFGWMLLALLRSEPQTSLGQPSGEEASEKK
jgi:hypothetical protein